MVAMTVKSRAPRKTARSAAASARLLLPVVSRAGIASSVWGIDGDVFTVVGKLKRPNSRFGSIGARGLRHARLQQVGGVLIDPQVHGHRRAVQGVIGQGTDDGLVDGGLQVVGLLPLDLLVGQAG